jgi:photosystem II stability/assembly factor-like uncharacterized protein
VVADPVDPLTVYAGGAGGLFKSADGGATWSLLHAGTNVSTFAVAPSAPQVLYELDTSGASYSPQTAMAKTTDGGATWQPVSLPASSFSPILLVVDPTDPERVYLTAVGIGGGDLFPVFYVTADGGATWKFGGNVHSGDFVTALVADPRQPATLYAGAFGGGIFRSTDRGTSWQPGSAGLPAGPVRSLALDPASGALIAAIETGESPIAFQLWRSGDGGATWQQVFQGAGSVYALAVDAGLAGRVYAGGAGVGMLVSRDDGAHWLSANLGFRAVDVVDLAPDPQAAGTLYAMDSSAGLRKSTDGGVTWAALAIPDGTYGFFAVRRVVTDPRTAGTLYASVGDTKLYKSADGGRSWQGIDTAFLSAYEDVAMDPLHPNVLFAAGESYESDIGTAAVRTTDGGATWGPISNQLGVTWGGLHASLQAIAFDPTASGVVFIGGAAGLFATADDGSTWTRTGQTLPQGQAITRLRVDAAHALYAVLAPGAHTLYRSPDAGATWAPIDAGLPAGAPVRDLLVDPTGAALYAGTDAGVFRSADGGAHWAALNQGLAETRVNRLVMDPAQPGVLYAGTAGGVYVSPAGAGPCVPSDTVLCFAGERFAAAMSWTLGSGPAASGHAVPLADGAGGFWLFSPSSTEVLLKLVDGRLVNGHFWVFAAGLSNVGYALTVTDTLTGTRHTYTHPAGTLDSFADTGTFAAGPRAATREGTTVNGGASSLGTSATAAASATAGCVPAGDALCVLGSRFQVQVAWQPPAGAAGTPGPLPALTVPLSQESGVFWFSSPESLELVVKVLDGRALGGHFWVFSTGLSSLAYTVTVTDTATGTKRRFQHPAGGLASQFYLF